LLNGISFSPLAANPQPCFKFGESKSFLGQNFCFHYMFVTNFHGHNKTWVGAWRAFGGSEPQNLGELPPNAPHGLAASTSAAIHSGELKVE